MISDVANFIQSGTRKIPSLATVTTFVVALLLSNGCSTPLERYQYTEGHMGTVFHLVLYGADEETANDAARAAFERVAAIDEIFSDYRGDSEVSRLCRTTPSREPVPVSDDFWAVMTLADRLARETGGAFDVTVGPFVRLWRRSERQMALPARRLLSIAGEKVGYSKLTLDPNSHTVALTVSGMRLDFGGIAKGYAAQQVIELLRDRGVPRALVDAGGDIVAGDPPPMTNGWLIGLAPNPDTGEPSCAIVVANSAVATSGDAFRFVEIRGTRYSHIIDPHTGLGVTEPMTVTVLADDGALADALASAVSVLGPSDGLELVSRYPGASATVLCERDGGVKRRASQDFPEILTEAQAREKHPR